MLLLNNSILHTIPAVLSCKTLRKNRCHENIHILYFVNKRISFDWWTYSVIQEKKITFRGRFFLSTLSKEFFDEAVNIDNCVFVESYFNWSIRWSKIYFLTRTLTFTISKLHSHIRLKKGIFKEHLKTSCWKSI